MGGLLVKILFESILIYFFLMGARRTFRPEAHQSHIEKEFAIVLERLLGQQPKRQNNPSPMFGFLNIGCALILAVFLLVDFIVLVTLFAGLGGG